VSLVNCSRAEARSPIPANSVHRPPSAADRPLFDTVFRLYVVMSAVSSGVAVASSASATAIVGTFGSSGTWKFCAPLPEGRAIGFSGTATDPICLAGRFVGPRRSTFRPGINPGFDTVLTPHAVVELVLAYILALWGNASSPTVLAEDFSKLRSVRTGQPASAGR